MYKFLKLLDKYSGEKVKLFPPECSGVKVYSSGKWTVTFLAQIPKNCTSVKIGYVASPYM